VTTAAVDLGATNVRVAYEGADGISVAGAADGTDAVPAIVCLVGRGTARVGAPERETPADEIITTVRADLRTSPRTSATGRYFHGRFESPEAVAGYVLTDAAHRVSAMTGSTVRDVLLGMPVAAADGPALRRAAAAAGLTVAGVIAEPVAAALHYGTVADGAEQVTVVHDLGATTLDVTVLRISGRNVAILRSARYPVGGRQWDHTVAGELLSETGTATTFDLGTALASAERLRVKLTEDEQASDWLTGPSGEREVHLDRARLEAITAPLVDQIIIHTRQVIDAAAAGGARADTVLLAGGASQMPMVARALAAGLGLAVRASQPQLAVVRGLALAQGFGLLFVTGQDGAPLDLPAAPALPPAARVAGQQARPADDEQAATVPLRQARPSPPLPTGEQRAGPADATATNGDPATGDPATGGWAGHGGGAGTADPAGHADPADDVAGPEMLTGWPVAGLHCLRRGERLLLTWDWPAGSVMATVRWRTDADLPGRQGSARCSKRQYEHDGGFELRVGRHGAEITVEALGYWGQQDTPDTPPPANLQVPPDLAAVSYDPRLRREWRHWKEWLKKGMVRWTATVRFASDTDISLSPVHVVLGGGSYRPQSAADGALVHTVAAQRLTAGIPVLVSFELTPPRGTCWLVCLLDEEHKANGDPQVPADLRPASLHRLKVRS
jgi:actin-like ATPase involved in cell morphogenesis